MSARRDEARSVLWRRLDEPGTEHVVYEPNHVAGRRFLGSAHLVAGDRPAQIDYVLVCDDKWRTRYAGVEVWDGPTHGRSVQLLVDPDGRWRRRDLPLPLPDERPPFLDLPEFDGLVDVDLAFSPLTNTLPIRRLKLRPGMPVEVVAAWLRFPELTIEPLPQRYERLTPTRYRYESAGGFVAEIGVDDQGLVVRYGDLWERVAASAGTPSTR